MNDDRLHLLAVVAFQQLGVLLAIGAAVRFSIGRLAEAGDDGAASVAKVLDAALARCDEEAAALLAGYKDCFPDG